MSKLVIERGISGSGKSTHSQMLSNLGYKVVSRDSIRIGLFNLEFDPAVEEEVTLIEHAMLNAYLKAGHDVVSDNTNIEWKFVKKIANIGYRHGAQVELNVHDVSLEEAKRRNDKRAALGGRFVPHEVIERQYARFKNTKNKQLDPVQELKPYFGTPGKPKAFMYDLDGTTYHMNDKRGPYALNVDVDDPDPTVIHIIQTMSMELIPIAMSGRKEVTRLTTEMCLYRDEVPFEHLFMRADDDDRSDNLVKADLFDNDVRDNYDIQFVLDDRQQVVDMWRRMGLTCLQVAEGDF